MTTAEEADAIIRRMQEQGWLTEGEPEPVPPDPPAENVRQLRSPTPPAARPAGTDYANAERLIARHGLDLHYCHPWRKWLVWDGRYWRPDDTAQVMQWAKGTVRALYREAADLDDDGQRKAAAAWAIKSEARTRLEAMVALAESEPDVPVLPHELDADPWAFNVRNGTLDLRTGQLRPHQRADLLTKVAPVAYNPAASAPTWTRFLDRIMDGNAELIGFLQRAVGYCLTGSTREECLFIPYGTGANGKSRFIGAVLDLLGDGYGQQMPRDTLMAKRAGAIPNDVARLRGARFAATIETGDGQKLDEELVKQLTGGDKVAARFMRAEFFDFRPECKVWLATNHKPTITGTDLGIWRRIRLIPFEVTIPPAEQDRELASKLRAELPGILAWAVRGCLEWQRGGLAEPEQVRAATAEYRAEQDVIGEFLDECCVTGGTEYAYATDLYTAYQGFASDYRTSQRAFGLRLAERGFEHTRMGNGRKKAWIGVGLTADAPSPG